MPPGFSFADFVESDAPSERVLTLIWRILVTLLERRRRRPSTALFASRLPRIEDRPTVESAC